MIAAPLLVIALLSVRQVASLDIGFHLKAGNYVLGGHGWPHTDPFTYTINDHPYDDTSWGYQVLAAISERASGAPGLVLFHSALIGALFGLLLATVRLATADRLSTGIALLLGGLAMEMRFETRPELLSYVFFAGVLYLLHRYALGKRAPLAALPAIFLAWINCHSLWVLGLGAVAVCAVGLSIVRRRVEWPLVLWGGLSLPALFVNPYGWRGVALPLTLVTRFGESNPFNQQIGEFVSPLDLQLTAQLPFYPHLATWSFRLWLLVTALALVTLLFRRRWLEVLLPLPFLPLALGMIRNMPILVVVTFPLVVWALPVGSWFEGKPTHRRAARILAVVLITVALVIAARVATNAHYIDDRRVERFGLTWNRNALPVDAAAFARRAGLTGPMLNHLNFGGWLMWARNEPVFIDGRLEVVGEEFFGRYRSVFNSSDALESAVAAYKLQWIVFPYSGSPDLLGRLSKDARWRLAYVDALAVIFVRSDQVRPGMIDPRLREVLTGPMTPAPTTLPGTGGVSRPGRLARWLGGLAKAQHYPQDDQFLGIFSLYRGELEAAGRRFRSAIIASGGAYYENYSNLGGVLMRQKRGDEAKACYAVVLEDEPGNPVARRALGY